MNIYLISQYEQNGYDTYNSMVVAARTPKEARNIHPTGNWNDASWCALPQFVNVKLVGKASKNYTYPRIILSSFNAG